VAGLWFLLGWRHVREGVLVGVAAVVGDGFLSWRELL
jgi:hypothetical protein